MEMMLNKKQIRVISLFEFKMGCKAETTHNINKAFGQRTANECTEQWWFKKFCKGEESLEDEEHSLEVDNGFILCVVIYMFQCYSLSSSHPLLPLLCPEVCSLYLHLYSCPASMFISTFFPDSVDISRAFLKARSRGSQGMRSACG